MFYTNLNTIEVKSNGGLKVEGTLRRWVSGRHTIEFNRFYGKRRVLCGLYEVEADRWQVRIAKPELVEAFNVLLKEQRDSEWLAFMGAN